MVLLTGCGSMLGRTVLDKLLAAGETVRCLDLEKPAGLTSAVDFLRGDLLDELLLAKLCRGVDTVFHLLDVKSPRHCGRRYMRKVNVIGTRMLAQAAQAAGVRKFIMLSSYEVYGKTVKFPTAETARLRPATRYGKDKRRAEQHLAPYMKKDDGLDVTIFRPAPLVAPRTGNPVTLITLLMAMGMEEANRVYVAGSGENRFQLLHPDDAAAALIAAYRSSASKRKIYNLGSDNVPTQMEQVNEIGKMAKLECAIKYLSPSTARFLCFVLRPFRIDFLTRGHVMYLLTNLILDCGAVKNDLGWRPKSGNLDMIMETIEWYRKEKL